MIKTARLIALGLSCVSAAPAGKDLPVLFQFAQPTHNVAVFRGADLKNAIAAGLVKGFGSGSGLGGAGAGGDAARSGKAVKIVAAPAVAPIVPAVKVVKAPVGSDARKRVVTYAPKPVKAYAPAPVVIKPAPVVVKTPVVSYAPAPKVAYKPYVDQYADEPAYYTYEYAVNDDYSKSAFDANESREQYLTTGKYSVALPDGRIQTVTYTVDGGAGYVADVTYQGEAVYPPAPAGGYTA